MQAAAIPNLSLPGLTRQSIPSQKRLAKKMDPRVKPAGDAGGGVMPAAAIPNPSLPGLTRQSILFK
jgi:hypothetical protein